MTMRCEGGIRFTKESAACPSLPHQVHSPRQGARVGECPRVHASILGAEAATAGAKFPKPRGKRKEDIKGKNDKIKAGKQQEGKGALKKGKLTNELRLFFVFCMSKVQNTFKESQKTHSERRASACPHFHKLLLYPSFITSPQPHPSFHLTLYISKNQEKK